jgi:aminoglycoside 3'-phosphotransferase-2
MSDLFDRLPLAWRTELQRHRITPVDTGMSGAAVFRVGPRKQAERYLKIAEGGAADLVRREVTRTRWLATQGIRVPDILRVHNADSLVAAEMRALPGRDAEDVRMPPSLLVELLGRALAALHALPAAACPFDERIAVRLARAQRAIAAGEVDASQFDTRNRQVTPEALYRRLAANPPPEELVVAHGDATLSNMIVGDDGAVGFVDCGQAGRADRYLDLAVTAGYIKEEFGKATVTRFARAYGEPSWQSAKAAFFADLYELF